MMTEGMLKMVMMMMLKMGMMVMLKMKMMVMTKTVQSNTSWSEAHPSFLSFSGQTCSNNITILEV